MFENQAIHRRLLWIGLVAAATASATPMQAAPKGKAKMPDFTKGDTVPKKTWHFWNLGATGAQGWMYSSHLSTEKARQIAVMDVAKGSPADGVLAKGDVILGVGGKPFSYNPRTEFGKALTSAEVRGKLSLIRWRSGKQTNVVLKLPVLGAYSATAPYNCPKSKKILERGCAALAKRITEPDYAKSNPIPRSLNALGLLASGEKKYWPLLKKEAQWATAYETKAWATWYYGYISIFLSEYIIATGDTSVMPGLTRIAREAADGQSLVGSWGHRFAGVDGRCVGYGMMNSPGIPLTTGLILARKAGVKDPKVDLAIERSARLIRFYIGKGAVPYGDHHPWTQTHEDNGKCGMAAVMFNQLGEAEAATYFARMALASHGSERDTGHTGNFFNMTWAMPAVALSGPKASGAWMTEFGAWYADLSRRHDGTFAYNGPLGIAYAKWNDCTGAYLLACAMPLKKIHLTGKTVSATPTLSASQVEAVIEAGRGWTNTDRNSFYDKLSEKQLLDRLGSWSPTVRERAAMALARRKAKVTGALIAMLDSPRIEMRLGAAQALAQLGKTAAPAVPKLTATLKHSDLWLRVKAAEALAAIGEPAMGTVPTLLEMLAKGPSSEDPRGMEQRYLMFAVFGKMLRNSLDGVDKAQLTQAVVQGLRNEDGRARRDVNNIYKQLSSEEIKPLLPSVYKAVVEPSASGIMFADAIQIASLQLLAKHRVDEGIDACLWYLRHQSMWQATRRTPQILKALVGYGGAAKRAIPKLKEIATLYEQGGPNPDYGRQQEKDVVAKMIREAIAKIESAKDSPKVIRIGVR